MDEQLTQLANKLGKLPLSDDEKTKITREVSDKVVAAVLKVIYENSDEECKNMFRKLSDEYDHDLFLAILDKGFKDEETLKKMEETFDTTLAEEIQSLPQPL